MRFWSIPGTNKIGVGCLFFLCLFIFGRYFNHILFFCCWHGTGIWVVDRNGIGSIVARTYSSCVSFGVFFM